MLAGSGRLAIRSGWSSPSHPAESAVLTTGHRRSQHARGAAQRAWAIQHWSASSNAFRGESEASGMAHGNE